MKLNKQTCRHNASNFRRSKYFLGVGVITAVDNCLHQILDALLCLLSLFSTVLQKSITSLAEQRSFLKQFGSVVTTFLRLRIAIFAAAGQVLVTLSSVNFILVWMLLY